MRTCRPRRGLEGELTEVCGDLVGDSCREGKENSEPSLELLDAPNPLLFRICLAAETFGLIVRVFGRSTRSALIQAIAAAKAFLSRPAPEPLNRRRSAPGPGEALSR
jgi:hypothetical protein